MKTTSMLTLVFALLSAVFFLLLVFFRTPFPLYPLMSYQDVLDLLTPLFLIPVYWLMFRCNVSDRPAMVGDILFMVFASLWVMGQGMHLSANSANNLIEGLAKSNAIDITGTKIYELTYFYDEYLSHYIWHAGLLGLTGLLIWWGWDTSVPDPTDWRLVVPSGVIYGFTLFSVFLEGQTVRLGLPFFVFVSIYVLLWGRAKLANHPLAAFFFTASSVAVLLFIGWGIYWGGFPEFSEVGLI